MDRKHIVVCTEIKNSSWRWISHHFSDSYQWSFCRVRNSSNGLLVIIFRLMASLNAVIKARRADVIVSHGPYMAFYCALFIWMFRLKTPHISYSFNFAELPSGVALKRMKLLFKRVNCFVVSSDMERALYSEYFDIPIEQIDFVRWGVAEPDFNLQASILDKPYISTVGGNARDYKTFMAAMAELPDITAIAVMRPGNLVGLDVPKNVTVLVNISRDEALSVIKHSVLTVLPLMGSETPCGHVTIVVAMYLGVPCVVTDSSGVSDYVTDNETGMLCEPNSLDKMKQAITHLRADEMLGTKLAENAEIFVRENCSEKSYVFHFKSFINRVCINEK